MNVSMLVRARAHFNIAYVPVSTARHNMRKWVQSIRFLRTESKRKWLLDGNVVRRNNCHV